MKKADLFLILVFTIILSPFYYKGYTTFVESSKEREKTLYWCTVLSKGEQEHLHKNNRYYDKVLVLDVEGNHIALEVTDDTWYNAKVGEKIPFRLSHARVYGARQEGILEGVYVGISLVVYLFTAIVILVGGVYLLVMAVINGYKYIEEYESKSKEEKITKKRIGPGYYDNH